MATATRKRIRRKRSGLGMTVLVPSADPASTIVNVGILITEGLLFAMRNFHAGQHEADHIVIKQNEIGAELDRISNETQSLIASGGLTPEILENHISNVQRLGEEFRAYSQQFALAGPGARATILGDNGGPGYLMGLLRWLISLRGTGAVSDDPPPEVPPETAAAAIDLGLTVPDGEPPGGSGRTASTAADRGNDTSGVLYASNPEESYWWLLLLIVGAVVARKYL